MSGEGSAAGRDRAAGQLAISRDEFAFLRPKGPVRKVPTSCGRSSRARPGGGRGADRRAPVLEPAKAKPALKIKAAQNPIALRRSARRPEERSTLSAGRIARRKFQAPAGFRGHPAPTRRVLIVNSVHAFSHRIGCRDRHEIGCYAARTGESPAPRYRRDSPPKPAFGLSRTAPLAISKSNARK